MNAISAIGKYLDQPILTAKVNRYVPLGLSIGAASIFVNKVHKTPNREDKKKQQLKMVLYWGQPPFLQFQHRILHLN